MPAGCDFICKNEECEFLNFGFTMTALWPMGKICIVLNSEKCKKDNELRNYLIEEKRNGKKLACIIFPNIEEIPIVAYRAQLWSPMAKCIWEYHIEETSAEEAMIKMSDENIVPSKCSKTGCELIDFHSAIKIGLDCPKCNTKLFQNRWFSED